MTSAEKNYLRALILLIQTYEENKYAHVGDASPREVLKELMDANDLKPIDLARQLFSGSRGTVSDILNGGPKLSSGQIKALSERFNVSPAVFFDRE